MNLKMGTAAAASLLFYATMTSGMASADTTTWYFNLPSTSTASQSPPYPNVATLTLTDIAGGVQFMLDPNESSPGVADPATTFVKLVDYVYSGPALTASNFVWNSGAQVQLFTYETNKNNMDSGYATQDQHILVNFFDNAPRQNQADMRFSFNDTSTWTITGTQVSDFTNTFATSGPKPTPIAGVISVAPYTLTDLHPTPSNWVAQVPEPSTYALMLVGLGFIGFMVRRSAGGAMMAPAGFA